MKGQKTGASSEQENIAARGERQKHGGMVFPNSTPWLRRCQPCRFRSCRPSCSASPPPCVVSVAHPPSIDLFRCLRSGWFDSARFGLFGLVWGIHSRPCRTQLRQRIPGQQPNKRKEQHDGATGGGGGLSPSRANKGPTKAGPPLSARRARSQLQP